MKKKIFSMHVDVDDFLPASDTEKEYMVRMRPSTTFFKDGMKRLMKNKIAAISMFLIIIIALGSILIPFFWPYKYDKMLGIGKNRVLLHQSNYYFSILQCLQGFMPVHRLAVRQLQSI